MNPENERSYASRNFTKLSSAFPLSLKRKEEGVADKLKKSKASVKNKLKLLYELMDEMSVFTSGYTACKKGCSYCCSYEVGISELEIEYIEKNSKIRRNKKYLEARDFHGTDCTFLKSGKCSIYAVRPYACRNHVAITKTNHWCQSEISKTETFPLLQFSGFDEAYMHILREGNAVELVDIRQVFGRDA